MTVIMLSAMFENGGNTVHRFLDGHPEFFVYPFESQMGTGLANDYLASMVPPRYRWPELPLAGSPEQYYDLFADEELRTYLRTRWRSKFRDCGLDMDEGERRRAFVTYLEDRPRTRRNAVLGFLESAFSSWRNLARSGRERAFVGFSPVLVLDVDKFFADFPDGHMIHVVRHPSSAFADTKKRPFPWSAERYAWTWNYCQHVALVAQGRYDGRFHLVRLEDLAADPEAALRPILQRMGFEWSDRCNAPSFNGHVLTEIPPWGVVQGGARNAGAELSPGERDDLAAMTGLICDLIYQPGVDRTRRSGVGVPR